MQGPSSSSSDDMHDRLRNYNRLQDSLRAAMEESLGSASMYIDLEARYIYKLVTGSVFNAEYNGRVLH